MPRPFICRKCGYDLELSPRCDCERKSKETQFKDKKFAATYSECVQIGTDEFKQVKKTKVFLYGESFVNVMEWLESIGVKNPTLSSVDISEVV